MKPGEYDYSYIIVVEAVNLKTCEILSRKISYAVDPLPSCWVRVDANEDTPFLVKARAFKYNAEQCIEINRIENMVQY